MSDRWSATDSSYQQETVDGGYFAPLAPAKYMLLTTFERDATPASAPVPAVVDGDRAYFGAWSRSDSVKRLRHTDAVQVTPCGMRGFCTYGPPIDAIARLLPGEEASRVAGMLAGKYPVRHRFLIPLLHRMRRRRMVHYELLAAGAAGGYDVGPEGPRVPDQRGDQSGGYAVHESQRFTPCRCARTDVTDHGVASIACIWSAAAQI